MRSALARSPSGYRANQDLGGQTRNALAQFFGFDVPGIRQPAALDRSGQRQVLLWVVTAGARSRRRRKESRIEHPAASLSYRGRLRHGQFYSRTRARMRAVAFPALFRISQTNDRGSRSAELARPEKSHYAPCYAPACKIRPAVRGQIRSCQFQWGGPGFAGGVFGSAAIRGLCSIFPPNSNSRSMKTSATRNPSKSKSSRIRAGCWMRSSKRCAPHSSG
jgi:hypothetical protein